MASGPYRWAHQAIASSGNYIQSGSSGTSVTSDSSYSSEQAAIAVLYLETDSAVTKPTDFTLVGEPEAGCYVYYAKTLATDTTPTWSWVTTSAYKLKMWPIDPPLDMTASDIGVTVGSFGTEGSNPSCPAITPGGDHATIFSLVVCPGGTTSATAPSGYEFTDGWTGAVPARCPSYLARTYQTTAASTGAQSWSTSAGGWHGVHIAFYPTGLNLLTPLISDSNRVTAVSDILPWTRSSGTWSSGSWSSTAQIDNQDEAITTTAADGDTGMGLAAGADVQGSTYSNYLTDTDSDFGTMDSVSIRFSTTELPSPDEYVDDIGAVRVEILNSALTAVLASHSSTVGVRPYLAYFYTGSGGWSGPVGYDRLLIFNYVDTTANKSTWDSAVARVEFSDTRNMGSDSATIILADFELIGSYTPSSTAVDPVESSVAVSSATADVGGQADVAPTQSSVAVTSATADVEAQADVNPVESSVAVTSATADVSSTIPINPVESSVAVASATADVGAQADVAPVESSVAVTSATGADVEAQADVAPVESSVSVTSATADVSSTIPINPVESSVAVSSATADVGAQADVTPIESSVAVASATADVSSTIPINPVESSVAVTSAVADVGAQADVNPVESSVAVTSATETDVGAQADVNPVESSAAVTSATADIITTTTVTPTGTTIVVSSAAADVTGYATITPTGTTLAVVSATADIVATAEITPTGTTITVTSATVDIVSLGALLYGRTVAWSEPETTTWGEPLPQRWDEPSADADGEPRSIRWTEPPLISKGRP